MSFPICPITHNEHRPSTGACVTCNASRTICCHCGIDIGASGADGGSWVPVTHTCHPAQHTRGCQRGWDGCSCGVDRARPLSDRIRPNSEAAPWVVDEVRQMEHYLVDFRQRALAASEQRLDQIADLREALVLTRNTIGDLRNGFARSVEPARWVEQLQEYIQEVLDKTK
jgi:hypothetical protein